jgi:hypothetical protein
VRRVGLRGSVGDAERDGGSFLGSGIVIIVLVMNNKVPFAVALSTALVLGSSAVRADEHHEHHDEHHEAQAHGGWRPPPPPPRPAPPRFQGHPPGAHPHGAPYHAHPVRVLRPTIIRRGTERPWRHWGHAEFVRPVYYWDWALVHSVTCTAEDSYGDQYPVTQSTWGGFGLPDMTTVEDDALDRCYDESGGDQSCYLATCSHY